MFGLNPTEFNRRAWDNIARSNRRWFTPASADQIRSARGGDFSIRLTGSKSIPQDWIDHVRDKRILAVGAGGGHQGPVLAAAGAIVTVADISENQLDLDRRVADQHDLDLETVCVDMANLDGFPSDAFDMVINPCSINFVSDPLPVWRGVARVLRNNGVLISGLIQPVNYLFDEVARDRGDLKVRFKIPYSDLDLPEEERDRTIGPERPIEFGHSLTRLIGGQLEAGFWLTDIMEDVWGGSDVLSKHISTFVATRSVLLDGSQKISAQFDQGH